MASEITCRSACPCGLSTIACDRKKMAASAASQAAATSAGQLREVQLQTRAASVGISGSGMLKYPG